MVHPDNQDLLVWDPCLLTGPPFSFVPFGDQEFGSAALERAGGLQGAAQAAWVAVVNQHRHSDQLSSHRTACGDRQGRVWGAALAPGTLAGRTRPCLAGQSAPGAQPSPGPPTRTPTPPTPQRCFIRACCLPVPCGSGPSQSDASVPSRHRPIRGQYLLEPRNP